MIPVVGNVRQQKCIRMINDTGKKQEQNTFNTSTAEAINYPTKAKSHAFHDKGILCSHSEMRWQHSEPWFIWIESSKTSSQICIANHRVFPINLKNFP